ncbi:MBOAT family protein [Verrucomicrobia bacterium LW23]|nr:MBOAT family protein [Verrucomicrobia bacterium LW23]
MVFSSHIFVFYFLPLALAAYYALSAAPQRWRNLALTLFGYAFYGWAEPQFIPLMFATTFLDWLISLVIAHNTWRLWTVWYKPVTCLPEGGERTPTQWWALFLSMAANLIVLGFFKYFNFGVDSYNALAKSMGMESYQWDTFFRVILPLGISFYTFQAMSYTIDVYRGDAKAMRNFVDFSCFVSMFPHLVAGPILKFSYLADQLENRTLTREKFARGVAFFAVGMSKKILLANPCGKVADLTFNAGSVSMIDAWYGAIAYAFQIYFDFSAYSDMAIGLGLMLGFIFAKNFDSPYQSASITEFWRRWHISLSSWLRDYLYIPLGGNRLGEARTYANLMLVMLLGGLWHGASWNFVIWGAIHGGMLAFERSQGKQGFFMQLPHPVRVAITFLVVVFAWVFFRAKDLPTALAYCGSMLGISSVQPGSDLLAGIIYQPYYILSLLLAAFITWAGVQTWDYTRKLNSSKAVLIFTLFWLSLLMMTTQAYNPFIYFIF